MTKDDQEKIQEIREALQKATPGPFTGFDNWTNADIYIGINAPEWLSYLLTELDAAKQEIERLNELTEILNATCGEMNREIETLQQRLKQVGEALELIKEDTEDPITSRYAGRILVSLIRGEAINAPEKEERHE